MPAREGYTPDKLPQLEVAFEDQVDKGQYDLDTSLSLLRQYSFSPEHVNIKIISKILITAMLQLPSPDFALMLHLIPERSQDEQPLAALIALNQHLEGARFQAFWPAADSCRDILKSVPGVNDSVRTYILGAISSTYQRVTKSLLADSLRLDGAPLDALIESRTKSDGWRSSSTSNGDTIYILPRTDFNVIKHQAGQGGSLGFGLEQVAPVLAAA